MMKVLLLQRLINQCNFLSNKSQVLNCLRLVLSLIIFTGFTVAQSTATFNPQVVSADEIKPAFPFEGLEGKKENMTKRDLYSRHYMNDDGSYTAIVGALPLHYEKNGQFFDIDHNITAHAETLSAYSYVNKTNLFESYFGASTHQGVKNKTSEGEIREFLNTRMYWEVNGQAVNPVLSADVPVSIQNDKAYYNHIYGNITAEFITLTGKRKLNYIIPNLHDLGTIPFNSDYLVFTEDIILPNNWTHTISDRGIVIQNAEGRNVYLYEKPHSTDATNEFSREENTIFEILVSGNTLTIKTKVKTAWILNSERQFPVKVDPTVDFYGTYMLSIYDDGEVQTGFYFGRNAGYWLRTFATYNLSSIPTGSTITSTVSYVNILANQGYNAANALRIRNGLDPSVNSGIPLYNSANTNFAANLTISTLGWKALTLNAAGNTYVQSAFGSNVHLAIDPAGSYIATNYYSISNTPYLRINYTAIAMTCATLTNLTAAIGSPVNGLAHHLNLSWDALSGATGYDVQYSTDGSSYTNASPASVTTTSYNFNAGDNPNTRYWFRVRAKDATQTCDWTYTSPIYTAADAPLLPLLTNAVGTTLDLTLQAETPVANPAITTYSIVCSTTGQFVQADGTLGATEVFRTKAAWGTVHINGLTSGAEYCFYARAKNGDGHIASGSTTFLTQSFDTNILTHGTTGGNSTWFAPNSNTPISWNSTSGCPTGSGVGFNGSFNNFWGNFVRLPVQNLTGMNEITMTFDLSNSFTSGQPNNNFRFYIWDGSAYRNPPTTVKIGSNSYTQQTVNNYFYLFDMARTCEKVTVTYDISGIANKSALNFYIEANSGYNNSNPFFIYFDNITLLKSAPTACIVTASAPTPVFHNMGGNQQIVFDNARYNSDQPIFRVSHPGASTATSYQIEMNTSADFTGTSILQTYTGSYPAQTPANFNFSNAENQLVNQTTYYVRARINIGSGYGFWSAKLHSYTYDTGKAFPNWFQTTTPQFLTDALNGTATMNDFTTVSVAANGGGANVFTDPSFETGQSWSTKSSYAVYQTSLTSNANGTNGITNGSMCVKFAEDDYSWQYFLNGEYNNVSQDVDLTGVGEIKFDLAHWRNTQGSTYACGTGRACKVVWSFKVIIGNAGTSNDNSGTEVYTWTPTTAEFGVTNRLNETIDLSAFGFTGLKTVKFSRVVTNGGGSWYDDDKYYLDNIRTGVGSLQTSGTIISTPIRLASVQGAVGYKELVWDQELAGGSVRFDVQNYNTVTSMWETVNGFSGIQDLTSNGEKSFNLQSANFPAYDSIRVVGYLHGNAGGLKLNDWAIFFTQPQTPLPVTLTSFTATCERAVKLSWSTSSEQNSDLFIVEKSRNMTDWVFVANQTAAGNSSVNINYTEKDENPWKEISYYRLRQLDFDGQEKIYGPISVSCDQNENSMTVYPNPNQGDFTIEISSAVNMGDVQLYLTDLAGKIITSLTLNIPVGTTQILIEGLDLQMGTYFVQIRENGNQLKPAKVVVNR